MKNILISESEKHRILEMHKTAISKSFIKEGDEFIPIKNKKTGEVKMHRGSFAPAGFDKISQMEFNAIRTKSTPDEPQEFIPIKNKKTGEVKMHSGSFAPIGFIEISQIEFDTKIKTKQSTRTPDEPVEIPVTPTINITPDYTGKENGVFCVDKYDRMKKVPCKDDGSTFDAYCMSKDGETIIPCKNDGTDRVSITTKTFPQVNIIAKNPFEFTLKMADKNNFTIYKYYPQSGQILGYGYSSNEEPLIVYQIDKDLTEDKVRRWFKKNGVKVEKF